MARELFVDTGAWVALADADDQHHARAAAFLPTALAEYQRLVTTDLVVAESYIILRLALGHTPAVAFLQRLRASPRIERVYVTEAIGLEAEEILRRYRDQDFSLPDAVSFALMRQRGMDTAFAFDAHFSTAGFVRLPVAA